MEDAKDVGRREAGFSPQSSTPVAVVESEIAREILAIHVESYGHGAANVRAHVLDDTVVVLLDGLELEPGEELLIAEGDADAVIAMRKEFQQAIAATFSAVIERSTGRRVNAFASQQQVSEPRFAAEIFRLAPD